MLVPEIAPPFPLAWGFSTKADDPALLPPRRLVQVHGTRIVEAGREPQEADGQWTLEPALRIGVRTADCVPVLLAGFIRDRPWVAALHAGWRGAVGGGGTGAEPGILRQGIALFQALGGRPEGLCWALGPSIQACHFEVGPEVIAAARRDAAWREAFVSTPPQSPDARPHLDLHGFLRAQALQLGLDPRRDGSIPRCTYCEVDRFHSFRRGDKEGRQWGWIEILADSESERR